VCADWLNEKQDAMRRGDIKLVMEDLCSRVFYNPRFHYFPMFADGEEYEYDDTLSLVDSVEEKIEGCDTTELLSVECIMLYLRPMSSMTEKERAEYENNSKNEFGNTIGTYMSPKNKFVFEQLAKAKDIEWLNAHHFDYRGLIEKGLALEAPEDMY
jgi:hypothetical protein